MHAKIRHQSPEVNLTLAVFFDKAQRVDGITFISLRYQIDATNCHQLPQA